MRIKNALRGAFARAPEAMEIVGMGAVAYGVALIYFPAGIIVAGLALVFLGYVFGGE